jgi:two-component system sensor histidine kinase KdpD
MAEDRAASFLQLIRRSQRGRLKVYLGYGPGVGKTYQMLSEGHRLKADGIDVVVGLVETHGRPDTAKLIEGLDVMPRRKMEYRGITIEEMDVDAILARKPQVALIDELAHTNAPDSRNPKRYQDVQEILAAGIHVISTLNVQHLESLYNTVERLLGVKVRERVPDSVLAEADVVVNVDLAADDLQRRLREGKVYPKSRANAALENFFTQSNLEHLRELTLREVASQLDFKRREVKADVPANEVASEQVMVCLSSRGPNSAKLLRYGSRLAGRINRNWYALYVQTPSEEPTAIDATTQRLLMDTQALAAQLGATVFTYRGQDVADTVLRFAREYRVGNVVIGRPRPIPLWKRAVGKQSVAEQLIERSHGVNVIVVDVEEEQPVETAAAARSTREGPATLGNMLTEQHLVIWDDPATKDEIFHRLAETIAAGTAMNPQALVDRLKERETTGSTFLNEGVALPHARMEGLTEPQVALGLTHEGVLDSPTENPIEAVFMLISPTEGPNMHLQMLASAGRMLQSRDLRRRLAKCKKPADALEIIRDWEEATGAKPIAPKPPAAAAAK